MQIPVFSAMGRILLINANGSANSSQLGSNTGHSGGGVNSAGPRWVILQVRFRSRIESLSEAGTELPGIRKKVCPSVTPLVRLTLEQHEQSTHTRAHIHTHTHRDVTALRLRPHPLKNLETKRACSLVSSVEQTF